MARIRIESPDEIKNLQGAEEALKEIAELQNKLDLIDKKGTDEIKIIRQKMSDDGKKARDRIKTLEANLALYAKNNRTELFKDKKSIELVSGKFGFRKSTKVRVKKSSTELLKKLFPGRAIRVKEEIDRDQLKDWSEEDLSSIDAARTERDEFGYEIKREEVNKNLLRQAG